MCRFRRRRSIGHSQPFLPPASRRGTDHARGRRQRSIISASPLSPTTSSLVSVKAANDFAPVRSCLVGVERLIFLLYAFALCATLSTLGCVVFVLKYLACRGISAWPVT